MPRLVPVPSNIFSGRYTIRRRGRGISSLPRVGFVGLSVDLEVLGMNRIRFDGIRKLLLRVTLRSVGAMSDTFQERQHTVHLDDCVECFLVIVPGLDFVLDDRG